MSLNSLILGDLTSIHFKEIFNNSDEWADLLAKFVSRQAANELRKVLLSPHFCNHTQHEDLISKAYRLFVAEKRDLELWSMFDALCTLLKIAVPLRLPNGTILPGPTASVSTYRNFIEKHNLQDKCRSRDEDGRTHKLTIYQELCGCASHANAKAQEDHEETLAGIGLRARVYKKGDLAIKRVTNEEGRLSLYREVAAWRTIDSAWIVPILSHNKAEITMLFFPHTLETLLKTPVAGMSVLVLLYDVACGLVDTHAAGFIHLDVLPRNILVTAEFRAKLGDFGECRNTRSQDKAELKRLKDPQPSSSGVWRDAAAGDARINRDIYLGPFVDVYLFGRIIELFLHQVKDPSAYAGLLKLATACTGRVDRRIPSIEARNKIFELVEQFGTAQEKLACNTAPIDCSQDYKLKERTDLEKAEQIATEIANCEVAQTQNRFILGTWNIDAGLANKLDSLVTLMEHFHCMFVLEAFQATECRADLVQLLPQDTSVVVSPPTASRNERIIFISRSPVKYHSSCLVPYMEGRNAWCVKFSVGSSYFVVGAVHLRPDGKKVAEQTEEIRALYPMACRMRQQGLVKEHHKFLLCGDFNSTASNITWHHHLAHSWQHCLPGSAMTNVQNPEKRNSGKAYDNFILIPSTIDAEETGSFIPKHIALSSSVGKSIPGSKTHVPIHVVLSHDQGDPDKTNVIALPKK
jgi:serine/threonine protein kinase